MCSVIAFRYGNHTAVGVLIIQFTKPVLLVFYISPYKFRF